MLIMNLAVDSIKLSQIVFHSIYISNKHEKEELFFSRSFYIMTMAIEEQKSYFERFVLIALMHFDICIVFLYQYY